MRDPFEEVDPVEPIDPLQELTIKLSRSMMWDMIGPINMKDHAEDFGQNPASMDVLECEAKDMWERKQSLAPFGMGLPMICSIASNAASDTFIAANEHLKNMPEELKAQMKSDNLKFTFLVTGAVIGHLFQEGLIKYGDTHELLGRQISGATPPE